MDWKRTCSSCDKPITYNSYKVYWKALKNHSTCRPCFYKSLNGRKHSEETKQKIGKANSVALLGHVPKHKGLPMSAEQKKKLSLAHIGKKASNVTKQKHRMNRLKRVMELGIAFDEDRGARQFFDSWNVKNNSLFKLTPFREIGYVADGYDANRHEWIEFDPPHHYYVDGTLKTKDIQRQQNIINHFKSIGTPLKKFIRVKSSKSGDVLCITEVYQEE